MLCRSRRLLLQILLFSPCRGVLFWIEQMISLEQVLVRILVILCYFPHNSDSSARFPPSAIRSHSTQLISTSSTHPSSQDRCPGLTPLPPQKCFLFSHYANPFSKLFFVPHPVYGSRLASQVLFTFTFSVLRFLPLACSPDILQIAGTHVPIQNLKVSNKKHEEQWLSSRKVSPAVSRHLSGTQWAFSTRDI